MMQQKALVLKAAVPLFEGSVEIIILIFCDECALNPFLRAAKVGCLHDSIIVSLPEDQTTAIFFKKKIFTFKVSEKTLFSVFFSVFGGPLLRAP